MRMFVILLRGTASIVRVGLLLSLCSIKHSNDMHCLCRNLRIRAARALLIRLTFTGFASGSSSALCCLLSVLLQRLPYCCVRSVTWLRAHEPRRLECLHHATIARLTG
jgi:hypothetical protein